MIKEAIEKIQAMTAPTLSKIDDRPYVNQNLIPILTPVPNPLLVSTLTSLKDYCIQGLDDLDPGTLLIHVVAHDRVAVSSTLFSPFEQRKNYINAVAITPKISFERRLDIESFIIQLQSMFVQTPERDNLLSFLGSLRSGFSKTMEDNGVSQTVTAKTSVTMVSEVPVPDPVSLQPYRTFLEIEQPTSDFVFRIHGNYDEPTCALYEADGGAWKLAAIERIAEWITKYLTAIAVIA